MKGTELSLHLMIDFAIIAVCIAGIWQFRTPRRARSGNLLAASAMLGAFFLVLYRHGIIDPGIVFAALLLGALSGYAVSQVATMIQIPSMVALQNGMGGLASLLVALVELMRGTQVLGLMNQTAGFIGVTLGALTFSGSMIAAAKLSGKMRQTPRLFLAHTLLTLVNLAAIIAIALLALVAPIEYLFLLLISQIALAALFGILFSIRVGGADMPVLISFLNATTGLAAAFCGIVIENQLLIAFGAMVAASGSILTYAMCKAMNRSLYRVFVPHTARSREQRHAIRNSEAAVSQNKQPNAIQANDHLAKAVGLLHDARNVVVVPGYGMALAQAQAEVVALVEKMIAMGKEVKYAIHPVAGRMPGHMNVLLAEAGVDYDMLIGMDEINPAFKTTDLVLVVGACDVVNPAAIDTQGTPISGMPILLTHEAKHVVCCNYDEKPGYSGVENPLYGRSNTVMVPGDAKATIRYLYEALLVEKGAGPTVTKPIAETPVIQAAKLLISARTVVVIPGYGMAIAQAQHKVVELASILERMGKHVSYAIHPVAGRMPGHMNVLLAEAEVDYDALVEMEQINPDFAQTDAVLIFGACDVVNPAAIETEGTPISGMPILLAHEAKSIIICNFDTKPGYSGVENPLYQSQNAILLRGDAKNTADDLIIAVLSLSK